MAEPVHGPVALPGNDASGRRSVAVESLELKYRALNLRGTAQLLLFSAPCLAESSCLHYQKRLGTFLLF